jgi:hypothetical protein
MFLWGRGALAAFDWQMPGRGRPGPSSLNLQCYHSTVVVSLTFRPVAVLKPVPETRPPANAR